MSRTAFWFANPWSPLHLPQRTFWINESFRSGHNPHPFSPYQHLSGFSGKRRRRRHYHHLPTSLQYRRKSRRREGEDKLRQFSLKHTLASARESVRLPQPTPICPLPLFFLTSKMGKETERERGFCKQVITGGEMAGVKAWRKRGGRKKKGVYPTRKAVRIYFCLTNAGKQVNLNVTLSLFVHISLNILCIQ